MVPLTRDGIIVSTLGRNGSIHLGRPAEQITLRDIYVSVIEDKKLWASRPDPSPLRGQRQRVLVLQIYRR
jgi:Rrf2 family transcriptional repressor of oqxAB